MNVQNYTAIYFRGRTWTFGLWCTFNMLMLRYDVQYSLSEPVERLPCSKTMYMKNFQKIWRCQDKKKLSKQDQDFKTPVSLKNHVSYLTDHSMPNVWTHKSCKTKKKSLTGNLGKVRNSWVSVETLRFFSQQREFLRKIKTRSFWVILKQVVFNSWDK